MTANESQTTPLWRDDRVWKIIFQGVVLALVFGGYALLFHNFNLNLRRTGLVFSFSFLKSPAGFSIGETLIDYSATDPYGRAIVAGVLNTFKIIILGLVATSVVGTVVGIASFSQNWLVRKLSQVYVEVIRNTPLLLQLLFWYFVVFLSLPRPREPLQLPGSIFMSRAAIQLPWPILDRGFYLWLGLLAITLVVSLVVWRWRTYLMVEQGSPAQTQLGIFVLLWVAMVLMVTVAFQWDFPTLDPSGRSTGGLQLSVEYAGVLVGLVVYTAAFIAEIVRGGVQSVSNGQWEAARSLGLQQGLVMRLVVLPQALRVIIPPLNSQYMNLAKNSSLALAIGYPDLFSVSSTTLNQTGRPLEVFIVLMATYLIINLSISLVMNGFNRWVQLRER
ncbi:amino acid ABC transporter permease [Prochlorothrix hollandica]|uniref:Amino acid ABC transporter permease n=1 Tax=Prochlorothrix hollandica PCC 9006 = CALU 1027 TaxID=317619 RepID=A0A0M2PQW9_PROHO|nr:ABC transporter permease subunit [Prochlorothrix hollandica]KKI98925.1 amino acid ABC transporter permease [Prochlorothrix hollandica PCC 9006 = CALU 1027]